MRARWAWGWAATLLVIGAGATACGDDGPATVAPATSVAASPEPTSATVAAGGHGGHGGGDGHGGPGAPEGHAAATSTVALGGGAPVAAQDEVTYHPGDTIEFRASEFGFGPATLAAEPGDYHGRLVNDGVAPHDITFGDGEPIEAAPGDTVEFDFAVPADGIDFVCSQPGHALIGMTGRVDALGS